MPNSQITNEIALTGKQPSDFNLKTKKLAKLNYDFKHHCAFPTFTAFQWITPENQVSHSVNKTFKLQKSIHACHTQSKRQFR